MSWRGFSMIPSSRSTSCDCDRGKSVEGESARGDLWVLVKKCVGMGTNPSAFTANRSNIVRIITERWRHSKLHGNPAGLTWRCEIRFMSKSWWSSWIRFCKSNIYFRSVRRTTLKATNDIESDQSECSLATKRNVLFLTCYPLSVPIVEQLEASWNCERERIRKRLKKGCTSTESRFPCSTYPITKSSKQEKSISTTVRWSDFGRSEHRLACETHCVRDVEHIASIWHNSCLLFLMGGKSRVISWRMRHWLQLLKIFFTSKLIEKNYFVFAVLSQQVKGTPESHQHQQRTKKKFIHGTCNLKMVWVLFWDAKASRCLDFS